MNAQPRALASRGAQISTDCPPILIVPESPVIAPPSTFIRVDFPAPFSPIKATISPLPTSSETLSSATTPGNLLLIPSIFNSAVSFSKSKLTPASERIDLLRKLLNISLLNRDCGNKNLFTRRYYRFVTIQVFSHQLH